MPFAADQSTTQYIFDMKKKEFRVSFFYPPEDLRGTALIIPEDDGETISYLVKDVQLEGNIQPDSALLIETETRIIPSLLPEGSEIIDWLDADTGEESAFAALIGKQIEKFSAENINRHEQGKETRKPIRNSKTR